ncbi:MAG: hypothetical protein U1F43_37645 [Myxococcota bacterium]
MQTALIALKRAWLADGISEADVHQVIPDRPSSFGVEKPAKPPASPEPGSPQA